MMTCSDVVGWDIGHSSTKLSFASSEDGQIKSLIFPSIVVPARHISDEVEAKRAALETVSFGGRDYFFGDTACVQGSKHSAPSQAEDWISSPEFSALVLGGLKKLKAATDFDLVKMVVFGLPANLYTMQKSAMINLAKQLLPDTIEAKVIPQPMGAYYYHMLANDGEPSPSFGSESWGIIDIGRFSSDFVLLRQSRLAGHGSCNGVRLASDALQRMLADDLGLTRGAIECDNILQARSLKHFGKNVGVNHLVEQAVDILFNEVFTTATRLLADDAATLDGILIAGGGAPLLASRFSEKWPHTIIPDNPRFAVADGFRRFGQGILVARSIR